MVRSFLRNENGNIALLFSVLIFVILGGAGMAIDFQRAASIRADLQQSADAAVLAAIRISMNQPTLTPAEVEAKAKAFFDGNRRTKSDVATSNFKIVHDPSTDFYRLSFDVDIDTTLTRAIGIDKIAPMIESEAKLGKPPYLEIAMVLDNTGSMNDFGKLGDLKTAATNLVTSLHSHPDADVRIGLVPFAQYVNVGADNVGASWLNGASAPGAFDGCVGSRDYPANTQDAGFNTTPIPEVAGEPCPNAIVPLTGVKSTIDTAITGMTGNGYTYIPGGIAWGWSVLSSGAPFSEGLSKTDLAARNGKKTMIVMTDGENTRSPDYPTHGAANITNANQLTDELCDAVKDDEIEVYTIAFAVTDMTIKHLLEDCGTTPDHYFEPDTASELNATFDKIASNLRAISLSK